MNIIANDTFLMNIIVLENFFSNIIVQDILKINCAGCMFLFREVLSHFINRGEESYGLG